MMDSIRKNLKTILISEEQIKNRIQEMGEQLNNEYKNKNPVLISVLKGSVMFMADLLKVLDIKCSLDFIAVSSYGGETESSGVVRLIMDVRESIENRNVLLVEDIVDTGFTVSYLKDNLLTRKPKSFKICTLLSKPENRGITVDIDYTGFEIPNKFVVGYGLDYMEQYRNLPFVGVLNPEVYRYRR